MIYVNWMAIWNFYRVFGIAIFFVAFTIRCIGIERKVNGIKKVGNIGLAITTPLIILALLEAIGINETLPVLGFALYDFF